jgi:putative transposase
MPRMPVKRSTRFWNLSSMIDHRANRITPLAFPNGNGPELIAQGLLEWAQKHPVRLVHIQPGRPSQNAYIERFKRTFRHEVLDAHIFEDLE